jgi:phospholipase C
MRIPTIAAAIPFSFLALSQAACSSKGDQGSADAGDDGAVATPPQWDAPVTRPDDTTANNGRTACMYKRGDMPAATLGTSTPVDKDIPIDTVVVIMMENHSFDQYFGHLGKFANNPNIEVAPDNTSNLDTAGKPQPWTHGPHLCTSDTNHEWAGTHQEINGGKMDGFAKANDGWNMPSGGDGGIGPLYGGGRSLYWYDQTDLPFYYALASTFAIGDHYHCSVPGPTLPNRLFLYMATALGITSTGGQLGELLTAVGMYPSFPDYDLVILDELEKRHTSWTLYADGLTPAASVFPATLQTRWGRTVTGEISGLTQAAQAGTLPAVSFVDPNLNNETGSGSDEHPPGDVQSGQAFAAGIIQTLMASPQWPHMAIFLTWDEHGGYYDHVAPPKACAPDSIAPILLQGDTTQGGYDLYGVRVPFVVVSPYAKKGYVGHHVYDHTSIVRFIEAKFKVPALTARDANAEPPTDLFDFSTPALLTPPSLPNATVDPAGLQYCEQTYGTGP